MMQIGKYLLLRFGMAEKMLAKNGEKEYHGHIVSLNRSNGGNFNVYYYYARGYDRHLLLPHDSS